MPFARQSRNGSPLPGSFDLDHLGAEVGKLQAEHVAGDEPREIEHANAVERALAGRKRGPRSHRVAARDH